MLRVKHSSYVSKVRDHDRNFISIPNIRNGDALREKIKQMEYWRPNKMK